MDTTQTETTDEQPTTQTPPKRRTLNPGMTPVRDSETARAMQAASVAARLAKKQHLEAIAADHKTHAQQIDKLERTIGELRADLTEAKARQRAAEQAHKATAKRLEQELNAHTLTRERLAQRTPQRNTTPNDPTDTLAQVASGSARALGSLVRSLATAARTGEMIRSGADAAALLDAVVRAAAAAQALEHAADTRETGRKRKGLPAGPGVIEASGRELADALAAARAAAEQVTTP